MGTRVETANVDGNFIMRSGGGWGAKEVWVPTFSDCHRLWMLGRLAFSTCRGVAVDQFPYYCEVSGCAHHVVASFNAHGFACNRGDPS